MKTSMRILMGALALGGLVLAGAEANACGNGKVIFEDKFETLDPTWGNAGDDLKVENGALVITPRLGRSRLQLNESDFYGDAAICVDVTLTQGSPEAGHTGILFWAQDYDNLYEFGFWPTGSFVVTRYSRGKPLYPMAETKAPEMKVGVGQTNSLEVDTKGDQVTLYVNDTKVGQFKGKPPEGGGKVGLETDSASTGDPTIVKFMNFVVAEPRAEGSAGSQ